MIGKTILNYEVLEKLGQGGMGTVYLAFDTRLERKIALKVLNTDLSKDKIFLSRFKEEAKLLAKLNHQNITVLYNLLNFKGRWIMVMEYVDGVTVEQYLEKKPDGLKEGLAIRIVKEVLSGLHYAHLKGIIHRDIKPGNIMIDKKGQVKLMDFGIAINKDSKRHTKVGNIVGSISYIAPELIKGGVPSPKTDIYSLGIVLYEMLEGKLPFSSTNDYELMDMHLNTKPPKITREVDNQTLKVLNKSLSKNPKNRYASALEFYKALDNPTKNIQNTVSTINLNKIVSGFFNNSTQFLEATGDLVKKRLIYIAGLFAIIVLGVVLYARYDNSQSTDGIDLEKSKKQSVFAASSPELKTNNTKIGIIDNEKVHDNKDYVLDNLLKRAEELYRDKKLLPPGDNLLDLCKEILSKYRDNLEAKEYLKKIVDYYLEKGKELIYRKKWSEAIKAFKNVLMVDETNEYAMDKIDFLTEKLKLKSVVVKKNKNTRKLKNRSKTENGSNKQKMTAGNDSDNDYTVVKRKEYEENTPNETVINDEHVNTTKKIKTPEDNKPLNKPAKPVDKPAKHRDKVIAIIPRGQKVLLGLNTTVTTDQQRYKGERIEMHIKKDVFHDGKLIFRAGDKARAVLSAFKTSRNRKKGLLELKIKEVQAADGNWVRVKKSTFRVPGRRGEKVSFPTSADWEVYVATRKKITY